MEIEGSWKDMETRGFVVLRNVFPKELLSRAAEDSDAQVAKGMNGKAVYAAMSPAGFAVEKEFHVHLERVLAEIRQNTDIQISEFQALSWYFKRATEGWHTDPPPYWMFQNLYQYVNFWIPIIKPRPDQTGLRLLPMDVLRDKARPMYDALHTRGGAIMVPASIAAQDEKALVEYLDLRVEKSEAEQLLLAKEPKTLVIEVNGHMRAIEMGIDIDRESVCPDIVPGDLIVARGDVLHRGQDNLTDRTALSIRAVNGNLPIRKDFLLGLSEHARLRLAQPKHPVATKLLSAFAFHDKDVITAHDVIAFMRSVAMKNEAAVKVVADVEPRVPQLLGFADYKAGRELFGNI